LFSFVKWILSIGFTFFFQNVSPISWKLGEKVITNCAVKLKNYLKEAVQSMGTALDDYSHIVTSICQSGSDPLKHEHVNGYVEAVEHLVRFKFSFMKLSQADWYPYLYYQFFCMPLGSYTEYFSFIAESRPY
jgi:enoyl-[acyl-carrier-protein] reductase (NADH)